MIKKVNLPDEIKLPQKTKNVKNQSKKNLEQKPDTFEYSAANDTLKSENPDYPSDCDNLRFKAQEIKFYDEDIEKMKNMSIEEKIAYKNVNEL